MHSMHSVHKIQPNEKIGTSILKINKLTIS